MIEHLFYFYYDQKLALVNFDFDQKNTPLRLAGYSWPLLLVWVPSYPVSCAPFPFGFCGLFSGVKGAAYPTHIGSLTSCLGRLASRQRVGDGLTIHALVEVPKLTRDATHGSGLLRRGDFGHPKGDNVLSGHTVPLGANRIPHLCGKVLVSLARLASGLGAGLGQLRVHVRQHIHHISVPLTRLDSKSKGIGASDTVGLGSHKASPICPRGDYHLARPHV